MRWVGQLVEDGARSRQSQQLRAALSFLIPDARKVIDFVGALMAKEFTPNEDSSRSDRV